MTGQPKPDGVFISCVSDEFERAGAPFPGLRGQLREYLARKHLAEAQQIAERGPMPLFLADVHLHRARMFRDKTELARAAQLIRDLGYGRRFEELADAEAAAKSWAH